ncbi:MAG: proteasome accessory factor PafA2 family protein [Thermodesulfobacteriota bacterium]
MERRILGTECEYALLCSLGPKAERSTPYGEALLNRMKSLSGLLVEALDGKGLPRAGEFLGNGGRFYIDRGGHPEYATPECTAVKDLVAHEKAGDRIVQSLVEAARARLAGRSDARLHVFKNNVDSFGTTYGGHENYLVTQQAMDRIHLIIPFLVTRQVFAGAGKVVNSREQGEPSYQLTQRSDFIDRVYSDRTSQVRGIINIRKREIPRQGQARRLHVIFGDSNMCEHAIALKIGVTAIVLTLLEEGMLDQTPELVRPVESLKAVSHNMSASLELQGHGRSCTALDIQRTYLEKAHRFYSARRAGGEVEDILELWGHTIDGLQSLRLSEGNGRLEDDPADLKRRLDWVLKLWLINRGREQRTDRIDCGSARLLDLHYHGLDPKSGLFLRCEHLDLVDLMVGEDEIGHAVKESPSDTRAWLRGMLIRAAMGRNVEVSVESWDRMRIAAKPESELRSTHPFRRLHRIANSLEIDMGDPFMAEQKSVFEKAEAFLAAWD